MKILIAGAGAVGTHLAKLLSKERHNIILMDEDPSRLSRLEGDFDLLTITASPTSIQALKEVEVEKADLVIAVTPDEARNMTCCMLSSGLGAKKTVARVDNSEYVNPENREFFSSVGISSLIYPEKLAATEIINSIKRSWIRQWWEVHGGELVLIGTKVRESAKILDVPLRDLSKPETPYHVVAIKRNDDTIIPHGDDVLRPYDVVYFMTMKSYIPHIRTLVGKDDYPNVSDAIIMGGGQMTESVLEALPDHLHIKVIEEDKKRCQRLSEIIDDRKHILMIHGDGRDLSFLQSEGIYTTDAFLALTDDTETNILSCMAAKRQGVRKTVALVENKDYISMAESLDIGTIINKKDIAASHIYQMMLSADVTNVKCLTVSNADVAEFVVKEGARITRHPVKELGLPYYMNLGGMVRDGKGTLINGNTQLQAGDIVVVFCLGHLQKIERYFN